MLFRQLQLLKLGEVVNYSPEALAEKMEPLAFTPCLPSFPSSLGWVSPFEGEGAPLVYAANGFILLCLQIEEKILPATVVRQALNEKVKKIEAMEDRKVRSKDKLSLKDEITVTLLPRAFSKLTRVYAYIDTKNQRLILGTTNQSRAEQFLMLFKKCVTDSVHHYDVKKPGTMLTYWLKDRKYPTVFNIEKSCVLQDPSQQTRIIRAQHQDLFANSIQSFVKDGCEVKQMALCWHDRINFILADDFSLRSIKFEDGVATDAAMIEADSKQEQFAADFFIMTESFSGLFGDLLDYFENSVETKAVKEEELEVA